MKKILYHGSPTEGLSILKPKLDPRLNIKVLFVADEPFGPMIFSLLPNRSESSVNYATENGEFIEGIVKTNSINDAGWLYTLEVEEALLKEREPGELYLKEPAKVKSSKRITKDEVLKLGWEIELPTYIEIQTEA